MILLLTGCELGGSARAATSHVAWVCAFRRWIWHPSNEAGSYCAVEAAIA